MITTAAPTLDAGHFDMMTAGDRALQEEVAALFRGQAALWRKGLSAADAGAFRDLVHTIKGSARGIGLWPLADACERAEQAGAKDGPVILAHLDAALESLAAY